MSIPAVFLFDLQRSLYDIYTIYHKLLYVCQTVESSYKGMRHRANAGYFVQL